MVNEDPIYRKISQTEINKDRTAENAKKFLETIKNRQQKLKRAA